MAKIHIEMDIDQNKFKDFGVNTVTCIVEFNGTEVSRKTINCDDIENQLKLQKSNGIDNTKLDLLFQNISSEERGVIFSNGKYRSLAIVDVAIKDPQYIIWFHNASINSQNMMKIPQSIIDYSSEVLKGIETNQNKKVVGGSYVLTFGKHKHSTINDIIEQDPKYILWLNENSKEIIVEQSIINSIKDNLEHFTPPVYNTPQNNGAGTEHSIGGQALFLNAETGTYYEPTSENINQEDLPF